MSRLRAAGWVLFYVLSVPVVSLAFVVWAVATRRLTNGIRRVSLVVAIMIVCGGFLLIRTGGITAEFDNDLHWRWSLTPEQQLIAQAANEPTAAPGLRYLQAPELTGQAFAGLSATASCAVVESRPTGARHVRSSYGDGRLGRRGHLSPFKAIAFTRRSNAATKRSSRATT